MTSSIVITKQSDAMDSTNFQNAVSYC